MDLYILGAVESVARVHEIFVKNDFKKEIDYANFHANLEKPYCWSYCPDGASIFNDDYGNITSPTNGYLITGH